jgi:hypothetical protein
MNNQRDRITARPHRRRNCDTMPPAAMIQPRRPRTLATGAYHDGANVEKLSPEKLFHCDDTGQIKMREQ